MKIAWFRALVALALWHVGCDGARVGAPKQQEGSFSNEAAPYEEEMYISDEFESFVRKNTA